MTVSAIRESVAKTRLRQDYKSSSLFQVHLSSHLRQLPHLAPFDAAFGVASHDLVEDQFAKELALASEHELFSVGLGRVEEAELRVGDDADAFERHQGADDVGEVGGQTERILVHHVCQIISQLLEVHFAELEIEVMLKESFDDGAHLFRINVGL